MVVNLECMASCKCRCSFVFLLTRFEVHIVVCQYTLGDECAVQSLSSDEFLSFGLLYSLPSSSREC